MSKPKPKPKPKPKSKPIPTEQAIAELKAQIQTMQDQFQQIIRALPAASLTPAPSKSSTSESEVGQPRKKRRQPAKKEEKDKESLKSIAPSKCNEETKELVIGRSFVKLNKDDSVPKTEFDQMVQLEADFPIELARLAYRDLAALLKNTNSVGKLNEATRQAIVFSLVGKICDFVISMFEFELESARPQIEVDKAMVWVFDKKRPVRGRVDIGVVKTRSAEKSTDKEEEEAELSNIAITADKTFYFIIEMKSTTINEGMQQALMYLKRAREMNVDDQVLIFLFFFFSLRKLPFT